jgi:hypothetical protein
MRSPAQRAQLERLHALNRARQSPAQRAQISKLHAPESHVWRRDPIRVARWKAKIQAAALRRLRDPRWRADWQARRDAGIATWLANHPVIVTLEGLLSRYVEPEPMSGCWIWIGPRTQGYGRVVTTVDQHRADFHAHRFVYERSGHVLPPGFHLHHRCRIRCCVNPTHLHPMTPSDLGRERWLDEDAEHAEGQAPASIVRDLVHHRARPGSDAPLWSHARRLRGRVLRGLVMTETNRPRPGIGHVISTRRVRAPEGRESFSELTSPHMRERPDE